MALTTPTCVSDTLTGDYKQMAVRMHRLFWRQVIEEALVEALGNRKQAAKLLGISYRSLFYAMKTSGFPMRSPGNPNQQRDLATGQSSEKLATGRTERG